MEKYEYHINQFYENNLEDKCIGIITDYQYVCITGGDHYCMSVNLNDDLKINDDIEFKLWFATAPTYNTITLYCNGEISVAQYIFLCKFYQDFKKGKAINPNAKIKWADSIRDSFEKVYGKEISDDFYNEKLSDDEILEYLRNPNILSFDIDIPNEKILGLTLVPSEARMVINYIICNLKFKINNKEDLLAILRQLIKLRDTNTYGNAVYELLPDILDISIDRFKISNYNYQRFINNQIDVNDLFYYSKHLFKKIL